MTKFIILIVSFIGGWIGWWLAEKLGMSFYGQFIVSSIGSIVGVFAGWKIAQEYF